MMTRLKFERISGHTAAIERTASGYRASCLCDCDGRVVLHMSAPRNTESGALESLRDEMLRQHGRIVIDRAGWACSRCGGTQGLSAHHKVFRSHGRDDRVTNLESLDQACHAAAHGAKGAK